MTKKKKKKSNYRYISYSVITFNDYDCKNTAVKYEDLSCSIRKPL